MTVTFTPTSDPHIYRMNWEHFPLENDVRLAFLEIEEILQQTDASVQIIVDLTANPRFPMKATLNGAMKVNQHPKMSDWLVIGGNHAARIIARSLNVFGRNNIHWYETENEAYAAIAHKNS